MTVHVVIGPPCSGKSTYIDEHAGDHDVVIDLDRMAHALGYPAEHIDWDDRAVHPARAAAMIARASLLKRCRSLGADVWITATHDLPTEAAVRCADVIELDPGIDECLARARRDGRPGGTLEQIQRWYGADHHAAVGQTSERW